jgi:hypothetical protein
MSNIDLIDDYLANKLSGNALQEFETRLKTDAVLQKELAQQQLIVEGIKQARVAELKSMLNKVSVSSSPSLFGEWGALKIAATVAVAGLLGTVLYWYNQDTKAIMPETPNAEVKVDSLLPKEEKPNTEVEVKETQPAEEEKKSEAPVVTPKTSKPKKKASASPQVIIEDPSAEMLTTVEKEAAEVAAKSTITISTIEVEKPTNTAFSFHYQFNNKKLFLYGPFEGVLYEILEVHGDNHALFLFFKDSFYLLDEQKAEPTELAPIRDRNLIQTLKTFRSRR